MEEFFGLEPSETTQVTDWAPRVDIVEGENEWKIKAELPEVKPEDIHLEIHEGALILRGERKMEEEVKEDKYRRIERFYGSFERRFQLPSNLSEDKVEAKYTDGILNITIPKAEEAKPKRFEIKVKKD
jgi:HSP20 family protein